MPTIPLGMRRHRHTQTQTHRHTETQTHRHTQCQPFHWQRDAAEKSKRNATFREELLLPGKDAQTIQNVFAEHFPEKMKLSKFTVNLLMCCNRLIFGDLGVNKEYSSHFQESWLGLFGPISASAAAASECRRSFLCSRQLSPCVCSANPLWVLCTGRVGIKSD